MKKLARREKTLVRLVILTVGVWLFLEVWDGYEAHKVALQDEIDRMRSDVNSFTQSLEGESTAKYTDQIAVIEDDLEEARSRILELPREADASLLIRSTLDRKAERSGLNINSISSRRPKELDKENSDVIILPTYIGYDTDLEALLEFFGSLENQGYVLAIDSVNISSRTPLRRPRRRGSRAPQERSPLTGNAVLITLFRPNANASIDQYQQAAGEQESDRIDPPAIDEPSSVDPDMVDDGGDQTVAENQEDRDPDDEPSRERIVGDRNGDGIPDNPRDRIALDRAKPTEEDPKPRGDMLPDRIRPTKPPRDRDPANVDRKPAQPPSNNNNDGPVLPKPTDSDQESNQPKQPTDLTRPPKPLTGTASIKKNRTGNR